MATTKIRGNTQIMDLTIENAQIASDAAIALSKLSDGNKIVLNDGTVTLAANLNAGGYKLTNLGDGSADGDSCTYGQLQAVATEGKAWKEVILYNGQLVDGASGGILAANVIVLNANLQTSDTVTLHDGTSSESYVADTDFSVGVDIDATLANLSTAINAGAIAISTVVSTLESIDNTNNVLIIYQDTIGEATRVYGNAGAATRVEILPTSSLYEGDSSDLVALPSSDPAATNFGFSRAFASLVDNETHYCRECDGSHSWDSDDQVWNMTGASSIPFASTTTHGKMKVHDGLTVTDGVVGVDLTANDGLTLSGASPNKTISVDYDDSTVGIKSNQLAVKDAGITGTQINTSVAGAGLTGGGGSALSVVVDDSSIEIDTDTLRVKALGVTNAMLAGSIADSKLSTIATADKVSGSAVQLAATTAIEDSTGLRIKDATAGDGLGITNQVMKVNVDDSSIEIDTDSLQVKALGITNAMLAGSIADSKLNTITTANKVSGSAVQISAGAALADDTGLKVSVDGTSIEVSGAALQVKADGIDDTHIDWGTGAGQVSAGDLPIADASAKFTATEVESALEELYDTQAAKYVFKNIAVSGQSTVSADTVADTLTLIAGDNVSITTDADNDTVTINSLDSIDDLTASLGCERVGDDIRADLLSTGAIGLTGNELKVNVDDSSIEISANALQVKAVGITNAMLAGSIADSKLNTITTADKVSGSAVQLNATNPCIADDTGLEVVVDDSSIERTASGLQVKAVGITNAMLAGSIADSKLNTITTANKVSGSAVQLAATSAIEDSTGLRIKDATAGAGLGISSQVLSVNVDDSSIEISTDTLQVKALGITNAMLAGSIADSKLNTITTADKVSGSAVQLATNPGLEDSTGLKVKLDGSTLTLGASGLKLADLTDGWVLMGNASNIATKMRMVTRETPNESADGSRTAFTVDYTPRDGTEQVYLNGILQIQGGGEAYTLSGSTITFTEAPTSGDKIRVSYLATN